MIDLIAQIGILIFSVGAVILVSFHNSRIRRWAYVSGLLSEPFWIITLIYHHQWLVTLAIIGHTLSWGYGFYTHWIKKGN